MIFLSWSETDELICTTRCEKLRDYWLWILFSTLQMYREVHGFLFVILYFYTMLRYYLLVLYVETTAVSNC